MLIFAILFCSLLSTWLMAKYWTEVIPMDGVTWNNFKSGAPTWDYSAIGNFLRGAKYTFMDSALPADRYNAKITFPSSQINVSRSAVITLKAQLTNDSLAIWRSLSNESDSRYKIQLSYRWLSSNHSPLGGFDSRIPLPYDLNPGASTSLDVTIQAPDIKGGYFLEFDLVQEYVAWFRDKGSSTSLIEIVVLNK